MGCTCAGREGEKHGEVIFKRFEYSLGLYEFTPTYIDRIFHRHSYMNYLTFKQLERGCQALNIPLAENIEFFYNFLEDKKYSAKKLSSLGVLCGDGPIKTRAAILFDNYDDNLSRILNFADIRNMVHDLFSISCIFIPGYASKINTEDEELDNVCLKLKSSINFIVNQCVLNIMGDQITISKEEFISLFEKKNFDFTQPEKNRLRCIRVFNKEIEPFRRKFKDLEHKNLSIDSTLLKRCSTKDSTSSNPKLGKNKSL